jgi:HK97 gp10 family phage protein
MPLQVVMNRFPAIAVGLHTKSKAAEVTAAKVVALESKRRAPRLTGRLQASADASGNQVVVSAPYSAYVEFGTSKMSAQPFFEQAKREGQRVLVIALAAVFASNVRGIRRH